MPVESRSGPMRLPAALCAALLAVATAPLHAATPATTYGAASAAEARSASHAQRLERRFLQITAANLRFQADASQLVLTRSSNTSVKDLAQTLVARHAQVQPELLRLLHARGMALPLPGSEHARVLKLMAKSSGAKLDRMYVEEVVLRSYQADIANFEKVAAQAEDPVLRGWIDRQLPTLRFHVAKAGKALPAASLKGRPAV